MSRGSRAGSGSGRETTAAVNLATGTQALPATAAASKLPTLLAVGAMVIGAATVGIFLGSAMGAFDSDATQTGETGPPSAAAPSYGPGDTLSRADAMAKVRAQAQRMVAAYRDGVGTEAGQAAAVAALIREARRADSREAAAVFLNLALELSPNDATAARLMKALQTVAALRPGADSNALGGDFLLDDASRKVNLAFVPTNYAFGSSVGPGTDGALTLGGNPNDIGGVDVTLSDAAAGSGRTVGGDTEVSADGADVGGGTTFEGGEVTAEGGSTEAAGSEPTAEAAPTGASVPVIIGTPPVPVPTATPASDVQ